jgi:hypothetical protein
VPESGVEPLEDPDAPELDPPELDPPELDVLPLGVLPPEDVVPCGAASLLGGGGIAASSAGTWGATSVAAPATSMAEPCAHAAPMAPAAIHAIVKATRFI